MTEILTALVLLATGYGLGRWKPLHRTSDWAHWQAYGKRPARHTPRWWAAYTIRSAENIGWLIAHPVQGWDAWQHRHDPPPPLSPPVRIRDNRAPAYDPKWAEKRTHAATEEPTP